MGTLADIILLAVLVLFTISGFRRGFIHSLVDFVGSILAIIAAAAYAAKAAQWIGPALEKAGLPWPQDKLMASVAAAVILFVVLEILIHVLARVLDCVFRLPVLRQVNAILGGLLGFCKGGVIVLLICAVMRISLPAQISAVQPLEIWGKIGLSRVYQAASAYNPIYLLLKTDFLMR